jgi:hypothetical protein
MYEVKEPFWQFVDHCKPLPPVETVWGTLAAANRQVKAANEAANRQIKAAGDAAYRQITAAQGQTQAAQRQTEVMREIERRRIAREGYAFHAMLEAAMEAVLEDVEAARNLPFPSPGNQSNTPEAYAVRQRIKRAGFSELRNGFLRFGGTLNHAISETRQGDRGFCGAIGAADTSHRDLWGRHCDAARGSQRWAVGTARPHRAASDRAA